MVARRYRSFREFFMHGLEFQYSIYFGMFPSGYSGQQLPELYEYYKCFLVLYPQFRNYYQ
jgi:hypothetical protein